MFLINFADFFKNHETYIIYSFNVRSLKYSKSAEAKQLFTEEMHVHKIFKFICSSANAMKVVVFFNLRHSLILYLLDN